MAHFNWSGYTVHWNCDCYTETVTAYIKYCIDDVTVTKTITTRANRKPWMTAEVRGLLKTRDEAFRSGDKAALKTARANLSRGIKMQNGYMEIKSIINSQTAEIHGACGKAFRPSLTTSPATGLWRRHIPPRCTQPLLFTVWNAEQHICTKTAHTSQRPGTLSVSSRRKEDPI